MNEPGRPYVVVWLNAHECEEYPGTRCVMEAHGPFSFNESDAFMARSPAWAAPHRVSLHPPGYYDHLDQEGETR